MNARLGTVPIEVSPVVPAEGWHVHPDAVRIVQENLATLCAGGRLIECERPYFWSSGALVLNGVLYLHGSKARQLEADGRLN